MQDFGKQGVEYFIKVKHPPHDIGHSKIRITTKEELAEYLVPGKLHHFDGFGDCCNSEVEVYKTIKLL